MTRWTTQTTLSTLFLVRVEYVHAHPNTATGFGFKGEVREPFPKVIEVLFHPYP